MAYRRKHGNLKPSTYEEIRSPRAAEEPPPLAAQAIRASSAHRDSSLSSAYGESAFVSNRESSRERRPSPARDSSPYEYTSMKSLNEAKYGFWGVLARKAKSILEDENAAQGLENPNRLRPHMLNPTTDSQFHQSYQPLEGQRKNEGPKIQKHLDALTSSLNYIGGRVGNALEEGLTIVENRTADIIQETRKLNIRRKGSGSNMQSQESDLLDQHNIAQIQTEHATQLKASRDVANAMAAKAKLLLRELKTVRADLAFAKERCAQLEEENKVLRENREKGDHPEDDDLIRLQLETLLAEKARLAHENSIYARENRFLREIVEYHQLTMQDVVYLDEGIEEVTEVYPIQFPTPSSRGASRSPSPSIPIPQTSTPNSSSSSSSHPLPMPPASGSSPATLSPQSSIAPGASLVAPAAPTVQGVIADAVSRNANACSLEEPLEKQKQQDDT